MKNRFMRQSPPKANTEETEKKVDKSSYCGILVPCDQVTSIGCKAVAYPMLAPTSYRPPETVCMACVCWDCGRKNCSIDTNLKAGVHLPKFSHRANPNVFVELRETSKNIPT
jgi:hypothetical protein